MLSKSTWLIRHVRVWLLCAVGLVLCSIGDALDLLCKSRSKNRQLPTKSELVLIGAYGNSNFGDDIVAVGIASSVSEFGFSGLTVIGRRENFDLLRSDLPHARFVTCGDGISGLLKTFTSVPRGSGLAILGGGGLLEGRRDDVNVHRLVLEYTLKLMVARVRGYNVGVHGIGVSSDFYSSKVVSCVVRRVLKSTAFVNVRDVKSRDACLSVGIPATLIRDPASTIFSEINQDVVTHPGRVAMVLLDHHRWPTFEEMSTEAEAKRSEEIKSIVRFMMDRQEKADRFSLFSFHDSDQAILDDLLVAYESSGGNLALVERLVRWSSCLEPFAQLMTCERVYSMRFHPGLAARYAHRDVEIVGDLQKLDVLRLSSGDVDKWDYPSIYADAKEVLTSSLARLYPQASPQSD